MTTRTPRLTVLAAALALSLTACGGGDVAGGGLPTADLGAATADDGAGDAEEEPDVAGMCAADHPDCTDTIEDTGAAGSCLAGDEGCTDESWDGEDAARPVALSSSPSGAEPAEHGATSGATPHAIEHAYLVAEDTLELTIGDNPCMLVEDVLVEESDDEVRVLVLAGQDARVDGCIEPYVQFTLEVDLKAPLGDRRLLDLAG